MVCYLLLRDDPGTLPSSKRYLSSTSLGFESFIIKINSDFHDEWRLQAESVADLLGDDGDADGDVVTDQADGLTIIMRCAVPVERHEIIYCKKFVVHN